LVSWSDQRAFGAGHQPADRTVCRNRDSTPDEKVNQDMPCARCEVRSWRFRPVTEPIRSGRNLGWSRNNVARDDPKRGPGYVANKNTVTQPTKGGKVNDRANTRGF